jgi:hypothetical protein
MKRFVLRIAAVSVTALSLSDRSRAFSKLRATGADRQVLGILVTAILGIALSAQPGSAAVTFSIVADTTTTAPGHGSFTGPFHNPSISGSNVAFQGQYSGGQGIYTGSVGTTEAVKVVDSSDTAPGHGAFTDFFIYPSVSATKIAFVGNYSGGVGLYTGSVGMTGAAKIVDTGDTAPGHGAFTNLGSPSISGSNVAFRGTYSSGTGIYTGSVSATGAAKVVELGDAAPGHGPFTNNLVTPAVSGSNLTFLGLYGGGFRGIYTGSAGAMGAAKVVDADDNAPGHGAFSNFFGASISGSKLAFQGAYVGGQGIYTGSVGATGAAKVVDTGDTAPGHGAFTGFGIGPSISGNNVVFDGGYSGGHGIYLATGGSGNNLSAVLNTGDTLFGSTLLDFDLGSFAYDNNAIAFQYTLADGRTGIGVASVPEPSSAVLILMAAAGWSAASIRRRRDVVPAQRE